MVIMESARLHGTFTDPSSHIDNRYVASFKNRGFFNFVKIKTSHWPPYDFGASAHNQWTHTNELNGFHQ